MANSFNDLQQALRDDIKQQFSALAASKRAAGGGSSAAAEAIPQLTENINQTVQAFQGLNDILGKSQDQTKKAEKEKATLQQNAARGLRGLVRGTEDVAQAMFSFPKSLAGLAGQVSSRSSGLQSTLSKSWGLVLGELAIAFAPAILKAAAALQQFATDIRGKGWKRAITEQGVGTHAAIGGGIGYMLGGPKGALLLAALSAEVSYLHKETVARQSRQQARYNKSPEANAIARENADSYTRMLRKIDLETSGKHERSLLYGKGKVNLGDVAGYMQRLRQADPTALKRARGQDLAEQHGRNKMADMTKGEGFLGGILARAGHKSAAAGLAAQAGAGAGSGKPGGKFAHDMRPPQYQAAYTSHQGVREQAQLKALNSTPMDQKMYDQELRLFGVVTNIANMLSGHTKRDPGPSKHRPR